MRADRGGVHFGRSLDEGYRACIELRTALRVLYPLGAFAAPTGEALYEGVRAIDWGAWLSPRHTLAVRASSSRSALAHTQFVAQKTKDAVVDQLRDKLGARPSVDLDDPDVAIFVHLARDHATVYLDLAGASLHHRGWRAQHGEAPLKESLAAAILRLSGWDRERPLVDPMCGGGTIAIEAASWARGIAPGLARDRFGFERWASHDEAARLRVSELRDRAKAKIREARADVTGSDVDLQALAAARDNARAAGVEVTWRRASVRDLALDRSGFVVTNPPYGVRLDAADDLYRDMARAFARQHGSAITVLSGAPAIERAMDAAMGRARRSQVIFNGDIECRLLSYDTG